MLKFIDALKVIEAGKQDVIHPQIKKTTKKFRTKLNRHDLRG